MVALSGVYPLYAVNDDPEGDLKNKTTENVVITSNKHHYLSCGMGLQDMSGRKPAQVFTWVHNFKHDLWDKLIPHKEQSNAFTGMRHKSFNGK